MVVICRRQYEFHTIEILHNDIQRIVVGWFLACYKNNKLDSHSNSNGVCILLTIVYTLQ